MSKKYGQTIRKRVAAFLAASMIFSNFYGITNVYANEDSKVKKTEEVEWRVQRFGGKEDLTINEGGIIPSEDGTGFIADYSKLYDAQQDVGNVVIYNENAPTYENSVLEFKMTMHGEDKNRYRIGIFPRFIDGQNLDGIAIDTPSAIQHSYRINNSEGWPGISNLAGITFEIGKEYDVKMETIDNKITMYIDHIKAAETSTIDGITNGKYAFRMWGPKEGTEEKVLEISELEYKEIKNSAVLSSGTTILSTDWGKNNIDIPIRLGQGDTVTSVKNKDDVLVEETDYILEEGKVSLLANYVEKQEGTFTVDISFAGNMSGSFTITKYDVESNVEYVWTPNDGIDAFEKISGSGTIEEDSEGMRLKGENKIVAIDSPNMIDGEIEITFEQKNDDGELGFLFRVGEDNTWQNVLHNDPYIMQKWYFKNSQGARNGIHGDGTFLLSRAGLADTKLKIRFQDDVITLWQDDYLMFTDSVANCISRDGKIGISTESVSDIVVKKVVARNVPPLIMGEETSTIQTIQKDGLAVSLAEDFPRVIKYTLNEKKMNGAELKYNYVSINSVDYPASATVTSASEDEVSYKVTVEEANVTFDVVYSVLEGNVLDMKIKNIDDSKQKVYSIGFPNQPLISANSIQSGAKLDATISVEDMGSWDLGKIEDRHYVISENKISTKKEVLNTLPFITTSELSASMANNVLSNLREFKYRAFEKADGTITVGIWNSDFMYRGLDGEKMFKDEDLYCQVVLTEDTNNDNTMDWQDGANALKTIIDGKINGGDKVSDSFIHVGYNFASQVQQPFLKVADNFKRLSNYIDGFDQILVFKGYANEGHDSAHADYDDVNKRAGGPEDMQKLTEIAKEINSTVGIHINHSEAYPEAKMFNDEVMSTHDGWAWLDQSKHIRREVDILNGGMDSRLNSLFNKVPGIGFVYVDTYSDDRWNGARMAQNLVENNGAILGTENDTDFDRWVSWVHWPDINDGMHRFVYHQQKDVYKGSNLFWGGYSRSQSFMSWQHNNNINSMVEQFYSEQLPQKYLMNHDVIKMTENEAIFENGIRTTSDKKMYKDGNLIADGGSKIFIPWFDENSETKNPDEADKIYHWNSNGGETTWTLPESWNGQKTVKLYQTSQNGKELVEEIEVVNNTVIINANRKTPYVVYKGDESIKPDTTKWSKGSPIEDTSFNSRDFSIWNATSESESIDHIKMNDDSNGVSILTIEGDNDGAVSQTMKDLVPGQKYRLSVWAGAEGGKTARLSVETLDGKVYENYTENTPMAVNNCDVYARGKKVQRMWIDFVQPEGEITAKVTLSADASKGGKATFMETRIVKTDAPELSKNYVAFEDFENVDQGFGIFSPEWYEETSHLSETHLPYTEDTISGDWSMKKSSTMRTNPSTMRLEPKVEYYVEFKALGGGKIYVQSESDGNNKVLEENFKAGDNEFKFVTGDKKDYIVRLENGKVIDDFKVYKISDDTPPTIPTNVVTNTENDCISITWDESMEEDTWVVGYNVYRNDDFIGFVNDTSFTDKDVKEYTTYTYEVTAVNAANVESDRSEKVKGYFGTDKIAPRIISGKILNTKEILLQFSEEVDEVSAQDKKNYTASDGVKILNAKLQEDKMSIILTVTDMPSDKPFLVYANGIKDTSSIGNICIGDEPVQLSTLVRYYKFDETDEKVAIDFIGNENGAKVGSVTSESGINGNSARFNKSKVQLSSDSLYEVEEWSVSTWINWDGVTGESQTIWTNGISGDAGANGMWFHIRNDQKIYVSPWANKTGKDFVSKETVPVGEWIHVSLVKDKNSKFTLYVNGEESVSGTFAFPIDIKNNINIGANINSSGSMLHKFNGRMDEFKMHDIALNKKQIKDMASDSEFAPSIIGNRFIVNKKDLKDLSIKIDTNMYNLSNMLLDGEIVDKGNYTFENNVIVINKDYLASLENKEYDGRIILINDAGKEVSLEYVLDVKEEEVIVDRTELYKEMMLVQDLKEDDYTLKSWEVLQEAVREAQSIFEDVEATQEEVDEAKSNLEAARKALVRKEDDVFKKNLEIAVEEAEKITDDELENVVPAVVTEFKEALEEAKAILASDESTQEQVNASFDRLSKVMQMLSFIKGDKAELQSLIDKIEVLVESEFIPSTWAKVQEALDVANKVIADENAMQEEVNETYDKLMRAFLNLRLKPNKDKLEGLINKAEGLDKDKYTNDSWSQVEKDLMVAKEVLVDEEATEQEVNEATRTLELALDNLKEKDDSNNSDNDNNNNNGNNKPGDKLPNTGVAVSSSLILLLGSTLAIAGGVILKKRKRDE